MWGCDPFIHPRGTAVECVAWEVDEWPGHQSFLRAAGARSPSNNDVMVVRTAFGSAMTLECRHAIVVDLKTTGDLAAGPPTTMCHEGTGLHGSVDSYMRTRTDMRT